MSINAAIAMGKDMLSKITDAQLQQVKEGRFPQDYETLYCMKKGYCGFSLQEFTNAVDSGPLKRLKEALITHHRQDYMKYLFYKNMQEESMYYSMRNKGAFTVLDMCNMTYTNCMLDHWDDTDQAYFRTGTGIIICAGIIEPDNVDHDNKVILVEHIQEM